jgi:hypothetical protein
MGAYFFAEYWRYELECMIWKLHLCNYAGIIISHFARRDRQLSVGSTCFVVSISSNESTTEIYA